MPGKIIISISARTYLIAIELLRGQVPFTLNRIQVAAPLPHMVIVLVFVAG